MNLVGKNQRFLMVFDGFRRFSPRRLAWAGAGDIRRNIVGFTRDYFWVLFGFKPQFSNACHFKAIGSLTMSLGAK